MTLRLLLLMALVSSPAARAYSVLTHMAIVDAVWLDGMVPVLKKRYPNATEQQLRDAHAYAYGGCLIQDLGYYPLGSKFFTDLTHYVRSADFVQSLVAEAQDMNELAFAMGAVSHYHADVEGHSVAINPSVPLLFPKLRAKFGNQVTYADSPSAHLKTEFGVDVLQVAREHYAPGAYHDFIGFNVARDLLDRGFYRTYGLHLKDVFGNLDLSLGTFRFSVGRLIPGATKVAWSLKKNEIQQRSPGLSRRQFIYNLKRSSFEKEWGRTYQRPGWKVRIIAALLQLVPRVGPLRGFGFKLPTMQTERMFEDSFNATVARDKESYRAVGAGGLRLVNRDLDTGKPARAGEYVLTDRTYDKLLQRLADKKFDGVTVDLRADILGFYDKVRPSVTAEIGSQIEALRTVEGIKPAVQ